MSTPAGRLSFLSSSTVLAVGWMMSKRRLWVRISNWSMLFLSTWGERLTVKRSILVGSGIGPATTEPVRDAVSAISVAARSSRRWSNALRRMRMRVSAINLFTLLLLGDLRDDLRGDLFEVGRLHGVGRAALRHGTDVVDVAEHFRERHFGVHVGRLALAFGAHDLAATAAQVADDVALELVRGGDFDLHDRFEKNGTGFLHGVLNGKNGGE